MGIIMCVRACGFGTGHWVAIATGVTDAKEIGIDEWDNGIMGCRDLFIHLFIGVGIGRKEMSE